MPLERGRRLRPAGRPAAARRAPAAADHAAAAPRRCASRPARLPASTTCPPGQRRRRRAHDDHRRRTAPAESAPAHLPGRLAPPWPPTSIASWPPTGRRRPPIGATSTHLAAAGPVERRRPAASAGRWLRPGRRGGRHRRGQAGQSRARGCSPRISTRPRLAVAYEAGGAAALSVLTDAEFFPGRAGGSHGRPGRHRPAGAAQGLHRRPGRRPRRPVHGRRRRPAHRGRPFAGRAGRARSAWPPRSGSTPWSRSTTRPRRSGPWPPGPR